jgi:hypothetical protein
VAPALLKVSRKLILPYYRYSKEKNLRGGLTPGLFHLVLVPLISFSRIIVYQVPLPVRSRTLIVVAMWTLWRCRNKFIYENQSPSTDFAHNLFRMELDRALQLQFHRKGPRLFSGIWMQPNSNLNDTVRIRDSRPVLNL